MSSVEKEIDTLISSSNAAFTGVAAISKELLRSL